MADLTCKVAEILKYLRKVPQISLKYNFVNCSNLCVAGDVKGGDLGLGAVPGREAEFRQGLDLAFKYATALNCKR